MLTRKTRSDKLCSPESGSRVRRGIMGSERTDVEFTSDGVVIRAWLYRPNVPNPPIIVKAHGLGGVKTMRLDAFAERFADAGYACLVFDYRHFGDSDGEPRQLLSVRRRELSSTDI